MAYPVVSEATEATAAATEVMEPEDWVLASVGLDTVATEPDSAVTVLDSEAMEPGTDQEESSLEDTVDTAKATAASFLSELKMFLN